MCAPPYYPKLASGEIRYSCDILFSKMSQQQPQRGDELQEQQRRDQEQQQQRQQGQPAQPVRYGDVFPVAGELASKPVAPRDAAMMQTAENAVFGQTQKGGPAATMQAAATVNERAGFVSHIGVSDPAARQGVTVTETDVPGACVITESVGGQVVGQTIQPRPVRQGENGTRKQRGIGGTGATGKVTIGEALEAVAATAGDKPVDQSDAAAVQAAEVRATGNTGIVPGGVAAAAQSAASMNAQTTLEEDKIKLGDILTNATMKLPADKEATRQDAEGVVSAELRNNPDVATQPGGVAASVAAAARLNERNP
ncbi:late embryogenesis abundant protein D-34 [Beta vulgaris subsp. vulgaris]|uniref:late embryogenesis abundant protein D-34 n=1 Tax=Beta vulgaris subsp. vulgaris TaxID=3555 RepID=UPI0020367715|nr:late embryogenesis abundant protein D-34 [Beta vulgaris subsp. vulgaris]